MTAWTISARSAARPASCRASSSTSEPSSPTSSLSPARASLRSWPLSGTPGSGPGCAPAPYLAISASVTGVSPAGASRRACRAASICCLERRPRLRVDRRCLARLRRSAHPGDQEYHETGFPAHIWNAAWIGGQRSSRPQPAIPPSSTSTSPAKSAGRPGSDPRNPVQSGYLPPAATPSSQQPRRQRHPRHHLPDVPHYPGQRPHRRTDPQRHRNPRRHHERASNPACRRPRQRTHAPSDSDPAHRSTQRMTGSHPALHASGDCAPPSRRPLPGKPWKGLPPRSPKPGPARLRGKKVRRGTNDHPACCRNPQRRQNIRRSGGRSAARIGPSPGDQATMPR